MTTYKCANKQCSKLFEAREADRKRGWARYCSKSCKAVAQEAKTGQYADLLRNGRLDQEPVESGLDQVYTAGRDAMEDGWD